MGLGRYAGVTNPQIRLRENYGMRLDPRLNLQIATHGFGDSGSHSPVTPRQLAADGYFSTGRFASSHLIMSPSRCMSFLKPLALSVSAAIPARRPLRQ